MLIKKPVAFRALELSIAASSQQSPLVQARLRISGRRNEISRAVVLRFDQKRPANDNIGSALRATLEWVSRLRTIVHGNCPPTTKLDDAFNRAEIWPVPNALGFDLALYVAADRSKWFDHHLKSGGLVHETVEAASAFEKWIISQSIELGRT